MTSGKCGVDLEMLVRFRPWSSIGSAPISVSANRTTTQAMNGPMFEEGLALVLERGAAVIMRTATARQTQMIMPGPIDSQATEAAGILSGKRLQTVSDYLTNSRVVGNPDIRSPALRASN